MKTTKMVAVLVLVLGVGLPGGITKADFTFGEPTNLGPTINTASGEGSLSVSANGLSLYFDSNRSGGYGNNRGTIKNYFFGGKFMKH